MNPRQAEIHRRLALIGPGPAVYFLTAVQLMEGEIPLEATTHVVAHCVRECESGVRAVLRPMIPQARRSEIEEMDEGAHGAWIDECGSVLNLDDALRLGWRATFVRRAHRWAHRDALAAPRPVDDEFRSWWNDVQEILAQLGEAFRTVYLESRALIDELAAKADPTVADASRFANEVPQSVVALNRFFTAAASPGWLPLLRDRRYFDRPSGLTQDEEGNPFFSPWPPGRYLERMAAVEEVREEVIEIELALETDNPDAHDAIISSALAMPAEQAARLSEKVEEFFDAPFQWALPFRGSELVAHLASGGEIDAAFRLFAAIARSDQREDSYDLRHLLGVGIPVLFPGAGLGGLELLADLLAVELERNGGDEDGFSYIWRPAIEHERRRDLRDALVSAVRDASDALLASGELGVFDILARRRSGVFRRLELHLLRAYPVGNERRIAERLGDRALFDSFGLLREYNQLARARFSALDDETKARILGFIEEGPGERPEHVDEDSWRAETERWQLDSLGRLGEGLSEGWRARFEALRAQYGEPRESEEPWSDGFVVMGARSPLTRDELRALGAADLIQHLRTWVPGEGWDEPSIEGLADEVERLVADDPEMLAPSAPAFTQLDPTYARALLQGLERAHREERAFEWSPVLEFCQAALEEPRVFEGRSASDLGESDPGWVWARRQIASLLREGLRSDAIPPAEDESVWQILSVLSEDPQPDDSYEAEYGGDNMRPHTLSLNANRSSALHTVIEYAAWNARARVAGDAAGAGLPGHVADVLTRHLDPGIDRSVAVRSVYGQRFQQLLYIDPGWATEHRESIFPGAPEFAALRKAAWDAYIIFSRPWLRALEALLALYERAIDELAGREPAEEDALRQDPDRALAERLIVHYWSGELPLAVGGLIGRLYANASVALRAHIIDFIGISLSRSAELEEQVPPEVAERIMRLWEWRFEELRARPDDLRHELRGFSWWFESGRLDLAWSVDQLTQLLQAGGEVHPYSLVVRGLAGIEDDRLEHALALLELLIERSERRWFPVGSREEIRTLLARGRDAGAGSAPERAARALANRLAAEGFPEFLDLF